MSSQLTSDFLTSKLASGGSALGKGVLPSRNVERGVSWPRAGVGGVARAARDGRAGIRLAEFWGRASWVSSKELECDVSSCS